MKRVLIFFLLFVPLFSFTPRVLGTNEADVKILFSYSQDVRAGTVRYISQIPESEYFYDAYWPSESFGGYRSPRNECGTASISMALSYVGVNIMPKEILEANNGYTYFTDWRAKIQKTSVSDGMSNYRDGNGKYSPVIIHLPNYSASGHWVILVDSTTDHVYQVLDPASEVLWDITIQGSSASYLKNGVRIYDTIDRIYQFYNASAQPPTADTDDVTPCPSAKFSDIKATDWYHESVDFALENGLFGGMSADKFAPNTAMTRAMLVTVLWRYEGQPSTGGSTFSDVKSGQWHTEAVAWASKSGVVTGVGNQKFNPNGNITREQMAAILYRYANYKGIDTSMSAKLDGFPDGHKVSAYANDAIRWSVAQGLINGSDGKLLPQGNATRAQVAAILMRFVQN